MSLKIIFISNLFFFSPNPQKNLTIIRVFPNITQLLFRILIVLIRDNKQLQSDNVFYTQVLIYSYVQSYYRSCLFLIYLTPTTRYVCIKFIHDFFLKYLFSSFCSVSLGSRLIRLLKWKIDHLIYSWMTETYNNLKNNDCLITVGDMGKVVS